MGTNRSDGAELLNSLLILRRYHTAGLFKNFTHTESQSPCEKIHRHQLRHGKFTGTYEKPRNATNDCISLRDFGIFAD